MQNNITILHFWPPLRCLSSFLMGKSCLLQLLHLCRLCETERMSLFVQGNQELKWSWAESKEKLYQTEENISWLAARGVNHSWPWPHAVPFSDSVTYSSSSRGYLCMDRYLKPPKFLTLYEASDHAWWLLQMAKKRHSRLCEAAEPQDFCQPIAEGDKF